MGFTKYVDNSQPAQFNNVSHSQPRFHQNLNLVPRDKHPDKYQKVNPEPWRYHKQPFSQTLSYQGSGSLVPGQMPPEPYRPLVTCPPPSWQVHNTPQVFANKTLHRAVYKEPLHPEYAAPGHVLYNRQLASTYPPSSFFPATFYPPDNKDLCNYSMYPTTHDPQPYESSSRYDGSLTSVQRGVSPPNPGPDFTNDSEHALSLAPQQQQMLLQHLPDFAPGILQNGGHVVSHHPMPMSSSQHSYLVHNPVYNGHPYVILSTSVPNPQLLGLNGQFSVNTHDAFSLDPSSLHVQHPISAPLTLGQQSVVAGAYLENGVHSAYFQDVGHVPEIVSEEKPDFLYDTASKFVDSFCPNLGKRSYCLPPVKRSRHPDKSSKQLVLGMESEKRVLGSFERYFAEKQQCPVFMLCHYPMSGFMFHYPDIATLKRDLKAATNKKDRDTITLLLLSDQFTVTIVVVSIISGNSDFAYIQRGVLKSANQAKQCSSIVSQWLSFLKVNPKVNKVIAFPNLKKAMMQRITKDKQFQMNFGNLCTLHVDDLSAPFEEEWSTPVHKHLFTEWMEKNVTCHEATLSRRDLRLVMGALLSPKLSKVDFVENLEQILPILESTKQSENSLVGIEDVSELQLTIDGISKPFDEFMDEYVSCYYPYVETQSYRVPPIHFNIQSFKKASDLVDASVSEEWSQRQYDHGEINTNEDSGTKEDFMLWRPTAHLSVKRNSNCAENTGPQETETTTEESDPIENDTGRSMIIHSSSGGEHFSLTLRKSPSPNQDSVVKVKEPAKGKSKGKIKDVPISKNSTQLQTSSSAVYVTLNAKSRPYVTSARSTFSLLMSSSSSSAPAPAAIPQQTSLNKGNNSTLPVVNRPTNDKERQACIHTAALQGVEMMADVMTKDTRADEGENRVISALEMLGEHYGPMFIICGYQYNNYLNKLREEMFSKGEVKRPIRAFGQTMRAEHDCLIFHKKYGAIVVCIKAIGDNFSDWGASEEQQIISTNKILEKAVKQLEREVAMIRHVTSDLSPNMVCHKLIALPNMTRASVKKALEKDEELMKKIQLLTPNHGVDLFLCADELPGKHDSLWIFHPSIRARLREWWERTEKTLSECPGIDTRVYRQVIGRYCGLLSTVEVWSPTNPRVEVRSMSQAVQLCSERFHKLVLLPQQVEILSSSEKRVFLYGPPGCGKTLLLILKAREWLLAGKTVIIVNSRPGSKEGFPYAYGVFVRLKKMMGLQHFSLYMISIDSLKFKPEDLACVMPSCCIIMDEVTPSSHPIVEHLCCAQVQYIWCAGQFEDDRPITAHQFMTFGMKTILRCPPIVQSLLKYTEPDVRINKPYNSFYQASALQRQLKRQHSKSQESDKDPEKDSGKVHNNEHSNTEELRYDATSVNKRLLLKYRSNLQGDQESIPGDNYSITKENTYEIRSEHPSSEEYKYDAASVNKRLSTKYAPIGQGNQKSTDCGDNYSSTKESAYEISREHSSIEEYKYDAASVNKRLTTKYVPIGKGDQMSTSSGDNYSSTKESAFETSSEHSSAEEYKYDVASVNKRLSAKFVPNCQGDEKSTDNYFGTKETSESLNRIYSPRTCLNQLKNSILNKQFNKIQKEREEMEEKDVDESNQEAEINASSSHRNESFNTKELKHMESLNRKLMEKYGPSKHIKQEENESKQLTEKSPWIQYSVSSTELGLPTDGPRPYIIDHQRHSCPGSPIDCIKCGEKLADHLDSMVKRQGNSTFPGRDQQVSKNKFAFKNTAAGVSRGRAGKTSELILFSNTSTIHTKSSVQGYGQRLGTLLDSKALTWSDVLIVAREVPKECILVSVLRKRNFPVEVLTQGTTYKIETNRDCRLFVTSYKEVTGLERALIVFVPTSQPNKSEEPEGPSDFPDFLLEQSLKRLSEEDRGALWHVASRSLASLVLILP